MNLRKLFITGLIIFVLFIFFLFFNGGIFAGWMTKYSDGFTTIKFYSIKTGSSPEEVYSILGDPFVKAKIGNIPACDYYSAPKNEWNDFLGWKSARICYDSEGKVSFVGKHTFY